MGSPSRVAEMCTLRRLDGQPRMYQLASNGPINVEDDAPGIDPHIDQLIDELARDLLNLNRQGKQPTITLYCHGYANKSSGVEAHAKFAQDSLRGIAHENEFFITYRWPSEGLPSPGLGSVRTTPALWLATWLAVFFLITIAVLILAPQWPAEAIVPRLLLGIAGGTLLVASFAMFSSLSQLVRRSKIRSLLTRTVFILLTVSFLAIGLWLGARAFGVTPVREVAPVVLVLVGAASVILAVVGIAAFLIRGGNYLLRFSTYFRDSYRALHYGAMDIVQFYRALDDAIAKINASGAHPGTPEDLDRSRIPLNFIGHSMGGYVVTNAVRFLSNVFESERKEVIGKSLRFGRLCLVSPDIPVESILTGRRNFLQASLRRFEDAYLVTNQYDITLSLISPAANYIMFPTRDPLRVRRLGNVVPEAEGFGVRTYARYFEFIHALRIGRDPIDRTEVTSTQSARNLRDLEQVFDKLTVIDCTEFRAKDAGQPPSLSWYPRGRDAWWKHFLQLPNAGQSHSGYFAEPDLVLMIYMLACRGQRGMEAQLKEPLVKWMAERQLLMAYTSNEVVETKVVTPLHLPEARVAEK